MQHDSSFPKGFLWGAATSSYQIEGGLTNDWSEWEKSPRRLAALKKRGLDPAEYQSGQAADSWNRFEEDIACLKEIGATVYRFSIEWSRIEPEEGRFDMGALNRYATFVARLREEGIEPFVTLWHWPLPLWLSAKGGWTSKETIECFKRYTERVVEALPTACFWGTLNEPDVFAGHSYLNGTWPPQKKNPLTYLRVLKNLILGHRVAYDLIKEHLPNARVGVSMHPIYFEAASGFINKIMTSVARWWWNYYFLDKIADKQDFIGVNYYHHNLINYGFNKNKNERQNDMGWELYPQGMENILEELQKRYAKPMYITESGTADADDDHRPWYIKESVKSLERALAKGVDVRGYLHWSLIDNFEWAYGYSQKFGLFEVDRKTMERRARPSAKIYADIISRNS